MEFVWFLEGFHYQKSKTEFSFSYLELFSEAENSASIPVKTNLSSRCVYEEVIISPLSSNCLWFLRRASYSRDLVKKKKLKTFRLKRLSVLFWWARAVERRLSPEAFPRLGLRLTLQSYFKTDFRIRSVVENVFAYRERKIHVVYELAVVYCAWHVFSFITDHRMISFYRRAHTIGHGSPQFPWKFKKKQRLFLPK